MAKTKKAPVKKEKVKKGKAKTSSKSKGAVITITLRRVKTGSVADISITDANPMDMLMAINTLSRVALEELEVSVS